MMQNYSTNDYAPVGAKQSTPHMEPHRDLVVLVVLLSAQEIEGRGDTGMLKYRNNGLSAPEVR